MRGSIGLDERVRQDVKFIKQAPYLSKDLCVSGYVLDLQLVC